MRNEERQVLLIINEPDVCKKVENAIYENLKFKVETTEEKKDAINRIDASPWRYDVVVIYDDLSQKAWGIVILEEIKRISSELEVIILFNTEKKDEYNAWCEGAFNCFYTPICYQGIAHAVKFAREHTQFRREKKMLGKLQELSVAINSATELLEIQNLACQAAIEILGVDHSGLVQFEKDLSKGTVIAEYPEKTEFLGAEIPVKGIPFEEHLVREQEIINIPDLSMSNDLGEVRQILMARNIRSLLIVPVILNNKVIASFSLDMIRKNRVFYSDEIELCRKLANKVAIAMGKARYLKELHILNILALESGESVPVAPMIADSEIDEKIKDMLEIVRKNAGSILDTKNFYIALYDEKNDEYWFVYHDDEKDDISKIPQEKRRKGMTAYVRRTKKAILLKTDEIENLADKGEIELVGELPRIWLGAPLIARKKVLGVIAVQNYENENAYDEHDLKVIETIAVQAAIVIDNAQLFKDVRRRIRDLEIVDNIVHTISARLNTKDIFKTITTQISEKLNCTHCTVFLSEKKNGELRLVPKETHGVDSEWIMRRTFASGEGLAGWVFQHGESIVTPDARQDIRYAKARQRADLPHSMLVVPVKVGNKTIGVISADQDKYNWFSETDRQLVDTLARHAGIAIERALGLNLLQEIGLQIIASKDEEEILRRIIISAIELTNTTSGIIYLISEDSKSIIKKFSYPIELMHPPPRMDKEDGITRQIIKTCRMFIVPDVRKDERINLELLKEDLGAMIGIPLKIEMKVVGVLYLNSNVPRTFSETECSLVEILASQAATAIYNSRLYKESQRQLTEIDALYEASQVITTETMNIKSIFETILEKAVKLSNADSAQIIFQREIKGENQYKIVFSHGLDILRGVTFKQGEGLTSKLFKSGQSIYTGDYHHHPDRAKIFDESPYNDLYNSLAIVPLKWRGEVIGAIAWTSIRYNHFTEDDIHLLERFSGPAAIAITVAREMSFRQTLLNNNPDAIVAIDRRGIIKEFNKATEKILGYTPNEILNKNVSKLWGGLEEAKKIKRLICEGNGTVKDAEAFVLNKDGEKFPVLFSGSLLYAEGYGDEKEEIGSIGLLEDQRIVFLRGRVRRLFDAIEQINFSNELYEVIQTALIGSIELFKADIGCIFLKDDSYLRIADSLGLPQNFDLETKIKVGESLIGETAKNGYSIAIADLPSNDSYIPFQTENKSALIIPLKIKERLIGVLYLESKTRDYFRAEDDLFKILSAEVAVAINRAQLQEEKEKTRDALFTSAKAVAAGQLATGFVHEVKNSLNTIAVTIRNISKRIQKESDIDTKSKQDYIDKINRIETEILRSTDLSMQLQRFGQRLTPEKIDTYLNDVVKNTIELLNSTIKKYDLKLELNLDQALNNYGFTKDKKLSGNPITIDKGQIEQVIINLILNAIEASRPRGRLLVETRSDKSTAEIRVTDYGKGITSEVFPEIFKPFFTTKVDGVGLGLYICKLIVEENHQGKIIVNSKPDRGTTFSVQLPRNINHKGGF